MATEITTDRLRELAETRSRQGKVLSLFVNLDPREFAAPPARATEISSVLDAASRAIRDHTALTSAERTALQEDVERIRTTLQNGGHTEGAKALQELVQAAGLPDLSAITAHHIVRRVDENDVRVLAVLLPDVAPGALLRGTEGLPDVFRHYWSRARADRFSLA